MLPKKVRILAYIAFLLLIIEFVVRIQQKLGPIYDLEFNEVNLNYLSDIINHKPIPGEKYDHLGIRINRLRPVFSADQNPFKFLSGFLNIKKYPLYSIRFFLKLIHTRIYMPLRIKQYRSADNRRALSFSWDSDKSAKEKYAEEIKFFEENLNDLVKTLIKLMGSKKKILFIYHPHRQHLKPDKDGHYWNDFVSSTVKRVTKNYDVSFYNATEDLKGIFNNNVEEYYVLHDMHFTFTGLKTYSCLVAKNLLPLIEDAYQTKQRLH